MLIIIRQVNISKFVPGSKKGLFLSYLKTIFCVVVSFLVSWALSLWYQRWWLLQATNRIYNKTQMQPHIQTHIQTHNKHIYNKNTNHIFHATLRCSPSWAISLKVWYLWCQISFEKPSAMQVDQRNRYLDPCASQSQERESILAKTNNQDL